MLFSVLCYFATGPQSGRRGDLKGHRIIGVFRGYKGGGRPMGFLEGVAFECSWYRQGVGKGGSLCYEAEEGHCPAPA